MTLRYRLHDARDAVSVTETSHTRSRARNNRRTTPSAFGLGGFSVSAVKCARAPDSARVSAFIAVPLLALLIQTSSLPRQVLDSLQAAWFGRARRSARFGLVRGRQPEIRNHRILSYLT